MAPRRAAPPAPVSGSRRLLDVGLEGGQLLGPALLGRVEPRLAARPSRPTATSRCGPGRRTRAGLLDQFAVAKHPRWRLITGGRRRARRPAPRPGAAARRSSSTARRRYRSASAARVRSTVGSGRRGRRAHAQFDAYDRLADRGLGLGPGHVADVHRRTSTRGPRGRSPGRCGRRRTGPRARRRWSRRRPGPLAVPVEVAGELDVHVWVFAPPTDAGLRAHVGPLAADHDAAPARQRHLVVAHASGRRRGLRWPS